MIRPALIAALLASLLASTAAFAAEKSLTLGVFLPTSLADGQKRFELSEQLGAELGKKLGRRVSVKNFGRADDFAKAARNQLDIAIVEGWVAIQLDKEVELLAGTSSTDDTTQRWAIVARNKGLVKDLEKKRLAVPRGLKSRERGFATNLIFAGDLDSRRHFKLVPVPNVESARTMLEANSAEAALVPLDQAKGLGHVLYRSGRLPAIVAIHLKGDREPVKAALLEMEAVAPLERFTDRKEGELSRYRRLLLKGPPKRLPVLAEAPALRPDPSSLIATDQLGLVLPAFLEFMETSSELPDD